MTFAEPFWLWITTCALLLFAGLLWFSAHQRQKQLAAFADPGLLQRLTASHSPTLRIVKNSLLAAAILAAGIALARPQWGVVEEELKRQGEDVVFVLDISKSMLARDEKPSRLERAKLAILDFVHRQKGGRVGFVVFAGAAFPRVPLTLDYDAFEENLREVSPEDIYVPGSDIARALLAGKNAFDKTEKRRVIILLSDGEDLEQNGVKMAEELGKDGVVIFTVGVGSAAGAGIIAPDLTGQVREIRDDAGNVVVTKLDEKTLRAIAESTSGKYLRLETIGGAMGEIYRFLHTDAAKGGIGASRRRGVDRYEWPLAICILLLVVESVLATRRHPRLAPVA
jgi:Ca-activated chloride channel family protein